MRGVLGAKSAPKKQAAKRENLILPNKISSKKVKQLFEARLNIR
jgi:hypothetical protein